LLRKSDINFRQWDTGQQLPAGAVPDPNEAIDEMLRQWQNPSWGGTPLDDL
jgi:hypothetical protein